MTHDDNGLERTIIAVDGPAAAGKGTLARRLAERLGFAYLDTGLLYRAVGVTVTRNGASLEDGVAAVEVARRLDAALLADPALRSDEAGQAASRVAAIPEVRAALLEFQRGFAARPPGDAPGAVIDGRDIGTVICPDATHKLFVTASLDVRARRRLKELQDRGMPAIESQVFEEMRERDRRDSHRAVAPLVPATDAFILDTSEMDADAALTAALAYITSRKVCAGVSA